MKKSHLATLVLLPCIFAAGYLAGGGGTPAASPQRKVLYYVDPMHPSYRSDKPGTAPDCGMRLEPVYADGAPPSPGSIPGTVEIDGAKRQMVGVVTGVAQKGGGEWTLRLPARVAADEGRLYVVNATLDGWITRTGSATTGSFVRRGEVLAAFYSPEFLSSIQAFLFALSSADRVRASGESEVERDQLVQFDINLRQYRDSLRNLGMGERQIGELMRTRKLRESIDITAPAAGVVLSRNVSPGERFERGKELYRIADLSSVWIVADAFGSEAEWFRPGMKVQVSVPAAGKKVAARVSAVPPRFDPAGRTMKIRLEAENPGFLLRPEMPAEVELAVKLPPVLSVPSDALIASGEGKRVFVEREPGLFEPRAVETGRSFGRRVEVLSGLQPGERIVVSGTFLVDSESRMKSAADGFSGTPRIDPVCGMYVDDGKARAGGLVTEHAGSVRYFCSPPCREEFRKSPQRYLSRTASPGSPYP